MFQNIIFKIPYLTPLCIVIFLDIRSESNSKRFCKDLSCKFRSIWFCEKSWKDVEHNTLTVEEWTFFRHLIMVWASILGWKYIFFQSRVQLKHSHTFCKEQIPDLNLRNPFESNLNNYNWMWNLKCIGCWQQRETFLVKSEESRETLICLFRIQRCLFIVQRRVECSVGCVYCLEKIFIDIFKISPRFMLI